MRAWYTRTFIIYYHFINLYSFIASILVCLTPLQDTIRKSFVPPTNTHTLQKCYVQMCPNVQMSNVYLANAVFRRRDKHVPDHSFHQVKTHNDFILAFGDCIVDFTVKDTLEQHIRWA